VRQERELVLGQAQDLLVLVEGLRVMQVRAQGQVEDWVLGLERALFQALELEKVQAPQVEQGFLQELAQGPLVEL
jgi:hypothetical protein